MVKFESFAEDLAAPREMAAHDRMIGMSFGERSTAILDIGAEKFGGKLIFHFFEAPAVGVTKKKADHAICEHPVNKAIDDFRNRFRRRGSQRVFGPSIKRNDFRPTLSAREEIGVLRSGHIIPSCKRAASDILL